MRHTKKRNRYASVFKCSATKVVSFLAAYIEEHVKRCKNTLKLAATASNNTKLYLIALKPTSPKLHAAEEQDNRQHIIMHIKYFGERNKKQTRL